jgi:hypothetical protein
MSPPQFPVRQPPETKNSHRNGHQTQTSGEEEKLNPEQILPYSSTATTLKQHT